MTLFSAAPNNVLSRAYKPLVLSYWDREYKCVLITNLGVHSSVYLADRFIILILSIWSDQCGNFYLDSFQLLYVVLCGCSTT